MVTTPTATTGITTASSSSSVSETSADMAKTTSDYDKFLLLLTTQMKNQDPTQPMDATQQIAQLAQFSSVEQQVKMNQKFDTLLSKITGNDLDRAANYLGKNVTAQTGLISWNGTDKPAFTYKTDSNAQLAKVVISDERGSVVRELPVELSPSDGKTVIWDGKKSDGSLAEAGDYSISVTNMIDKNDLSKTTTTDAITASRVLKAVNDQKQGVLITLANGKKVNINDIIGVVENTSS
jgi:flagellar basal-body rod modification protein FlgD